MPESTPSIKVNNVKRLGGNAVLHGVDFDASKAECLRRSAEEGLTFIPPYDDPLVIAGQGTIAMEICRQMADPGALDGIFGAVGGGGLVAGISAYMKRVGGPGVQVFGVETVDGDAMDRSLKAGHRVLLDEVGPFADGTAVRIVGEESFRVCKEFVDGVVIVNNDEICAAIKDVFEGEHCPLQTTGQHLTCFADSFQRHARSPSLPVRWRSQASRRTSAGTGSRTLARSLWLWSQVAT
jgi:threonine dehydratase